ncbi:MAG: HsmA family protein [Arachnia sp.]
MLPAAIVIITVAFVCYTVGVWGERIQGILKPWQAWFFAAGLACDATGTFLMTRIAAARGAANLAAGPLTQLMAVTGTIAILLMAFHLGWALLVIKRDIDAQKRTFHRFSVLVWAIWLVPYAAGAASAMVG